MKKCISIHLPFTFCQVNVRVHDLGMIFKKKTKEARIGVVTDLLDPGDTVCLTEKCIAYIIRQVLHALVFLHNNMKESLVTRCCKYLQQHPELDRKVLPSELIEKLESNEKCFIHGKLMTDYLLIDTSGSIKLGINPSF